MDYIRSTKKGKVAPGVSGRWLVNANGQRELAIIINDQTTSSQWRDAWSVIQTLQQQVKEKDGSDFKRNLILTLRLKTYYKYHFEQLSYNTIAMETNYECLVNLCRAVYELNNGDKAEMYKSMSIAGQHLMAMRMKPVDAKQWIIEGIGEIVRGHAPWTLDKGPIDGIRVRDAIRQFQKEVDIKKIVIKPDNVLNFPKTEQVSPEHIDALPENRIPPELANLLLSREPESGGLVFLKNELRRLINYNSPALAIKLDI